MAIGKAHETAKLTAKLGFSGLGWMGGLFAAALFGSDVSIGIFAAATLVSAALLLCGAKYGRFALLISAAALMAAAFLTGYDTFIVSPLRSLAGSEVAVEGVVTDSVQASGGKDRLTVIGRLGTGKRARVSILSEDTTVMVGDRISARFTVKLPENTPLYDGEDRSAAQGIFITSKGTAEVTRLGVGSVTRRLTNRLRESTIRSIRRRCKGQAGAFIVSILCADKQFLDTRTRNAVYRSGLGHIFAVSGTHIVILSSVLMRLLTVLVRPKKLRSGLMLAILAAFALFAGGTPSVVRACILCGFGHLAVFFSRKSSSPNSLGAAAFMITLACPYAAFSASFLLSFASAFALSVILPEISGRSKLRTLILPFVIFTMTFSLAAYYFCEIPLFFAVANILLLPLCTVCLSCAFIFMLSGGLLTPFLSVSGLCVEIVISLCSLLTKLPFTYAGVSHRPQLMLIGAAGALAMILTALSRNSKRVKSAVCVTTALTICASSAVISLVKPRDRVTVIPGIRGYTVEVVADGRLLIFDIGGKGSGRFHADRTAKELHTEQVYLFMTTAPLQTRILYRKTLPDLRAAISPGGRYELTDANGVFMTGSAVVTYDGVYDIRLRGHSVRLEKKSVTIDGTGYAVDGFYDTSTVVLK